MEAILLLVTATLSYATKDVPKVLNEANSNIKCTYLNPVHILVILQDSALFCSIFHNGIYYILFVQDLISHS